MTIALLVVSSGLVLLMFGHRPIRRLSRSRADPRVAILTWLTAIVAAPGMVLTGIVVLLLPGHAGLGDLLRSAGGCVVHLGTEIVPNREEVSGLVAIAAMALLTAWAMVVAVRLARARRRRSQHHRFLLALVAHPDQQFGESIYWLDDVSPVAYSIGGRPGRIVISRGLRDRLSPAGLGAAIEHERAHLRGRHHALLAVADALAAAFPIIPLLREAPKDLRVLVEFTADASAARRWGVPALQSALQVVAGVTVPPGELGMAGGTVADRLARLRSPYRHSAPCRLVQSGAAALAAIALPLLTSTALFLIVACPAG